MTDNRQQEENHLLNDIEDDGELTETSELSSTYEKSELRSESPSFNLVDSLSTSDELMHSTTDPLIQWYDIIFQQQMSGWKDEILKYLPEFEGFAWRLCNVWFNHIPVIKDIPIKYLEIGTLCGANLISVCKTYGQHPESVFECIDPWIDYDEYWEYKTPASWNTNVQQTNFEQFLHNIKEAGEEDRVKYYKNFSHIILPQLKDYDYNMIYIDGNHDPQYVLEDGVLCLRKLKPGGWLIFDDYGFNGVHGPKVAIDAFIKVYKQRFAWIYFNEDHGQVYLQLKKD